MPRNFFRQAQHFITEACNKCRIFPLRHGMLRRLHLLLSLNRHRECRINAGKIPPIEQRTDTHHRIRERQINGGNNQVDAFTPQLPCVNIYCADDTAHSNPRKSARNFCRQVAGAAHADRTHDHSGDVLRFLLHPLHGRAQMHRNIRTFFWRNAVYL